MSILHLEHISYTYEKSETPVLRDITADFEAGKMYAVIGKSGAGKSTLLSLVSGLDVCREGTISYNGENLKCINRDKYRALNIGVVFQSYNLLLNASAVENGCPFHEFEWGQEQRQEAVGIRGFWKKSELTG